MRRECSAGSGAFLSRRYYVGGESLRMKHELVGEDLSFRYELLNARELDPEALLASPSVGDNVMAILTRLRASQDAVRQILRSVAALERPDRDVAFEALLMLAGLRELEETVEMEARNMPVFDDILENKVLGREYKRGLERGLEQGRLSGELDLLRIVIVDRFGSVPPALDSKISAMGPAELEEMARRVSRAATLDDLLT